MWRIMARLRSGHAVNSGTAKERVNLIKGRKILMLNSSHDTLTTIGNEETFIPDYQLILKRPLQN